MKTYFGVGRNYARDAFKLEIDYSLDDVEDTLALFNAGKTPDNFLENFTYQQRGGRIFEDMLANNMGWCIFSARVAELLQACRNATEVELLALPPNALQINSVLRDYFVLGVKRWIKCVDHAHSNILYEEIEGKKHISSFRRCVLIEEQVPNGVDVFLMEEYPVFAVISSELALKISELRPTGFIFEEITAL
jgi:hypothetical protein